jgi:hypothetical protein
MGRWPVDTSSQHGKHLRMWAESEMRVRQTFAYMGERKGSLSGSPHYFAK